MHLVVVLIFRCSSNSGSGSGSGSGSSSGGASGSGCDSGSGCRDTGGSRGERISRREMIAEDLNAKIKAKYPNRHVKIEVSEDGENGCLMDFGR